LKPANEYRAYGARPSVVKCPVVRLRICARQYSSPIVDTATSSFTGASLYNARSRLISFSACSRNVARVTAMSLCARGVAKSAMATAMAKGFI
jgi:hypothetical protein